MNLYRDTGESFIWWFWSLSCILALFFSNLFYNQMEGAGSHEKRAEDF
jgi:hypothetical protein